MVPGIEVIDDGIVSVAVVVAVGENVILGARVLEGIDSGVSKCGGTASTVRAAAVLTLAIASSIML